MNLQGLTGFISESSKNINYKGYIIDTSDISVTNYINEYVIPNNLNVNVVEYNNIGDIREELVEIIGGTSQSVNDTVITGGDYDQDNEILIK